MENEYFLSAGNSQPAMQSWNSFPLAQMPSRSSQFDYFNQFESPLSTMVPFPVTTAPAPVPESNVHVDKTISSYSCFSTPPKMGNSRVSNPLLPALSADPGFVEWAAKFSCFGSRSFEGRRSDFDYNKLQSVSSTPNFKNSGFSMDSKNSCEAQMDNKKWTSAGNNGNEESSVSDVSRAPTEGNSKKRKAVPRCKPKEEASAEASNAYQEGVDDPKNKNRSRTLEARGSENGGVDGKKEAKGGAIAAEDGPQKQDKLKQRHPEPPKDYIHVRARRGQATDSHSLAERVRREKISERMKFLQNLVPGCNKVTGKALMLDEIINYVKSLQHRVEFLSMKLSSVNPRWESNMDNFTSKDKMQQDGAFSHSIYRVDSLVPPFYGHHQPWQSPSVHTIASVSQCPVDSMAVCSTSYQSLQAHLPSLNGFAEGLPQFHGYFEDDLHSIVQMGFGQDLEREAAFHSPTVTNQTSQLKLDLSSPSHLEIKYEVNEHPRP